MPARHNTLALFAALATAALAFLAGTPAQAGNRVVVGSRLVVPGIGVHHHGSFSRFVFGAPINAYTYYPQPYVYVSAPHPDYTVVPPPPPMYRDYRRRYYNERFYGGPPRFAPNPYWNRYNSFGPRYYNDRPYNTRRYYDRSTGDRYIERRVPLRERRDVYREKRIPLRERGR